MELALIDLRERRAALLAEIEALEQRRKQLEQDLDGTLSGRADGIARRLKGFQDYLVVALQDLAGQAELMDLVVQPLQVQPSPWTLRRRRCRQPRRWSSRALRRRRASSARTPS